MAKNVRAPKAVKKPATKAAGVPVPAPAVPATAVVAKEPKAPSKDDPKPTPVTIVGPKQESTVQPNPEPVVRIEPVVAAKPMKGLTPEEEIIEVEKQLASLQARLWELQHPIIEFPKMVNGRTFTNRAEQDSAGPEFKDKK